ncbi:ABC1 kinase family protein [Pontibacillus marinus]|uniref:ABC transporter n=1 Tax=Pontibacillus marinus BH030004 = DSM 16465 TaxID=1385511 RepID=A0A0A5FUK3_9BACI|nr:AarF/UbiB family protein [Pontibacillus marinus]KGX83559.1 ABC transporter [Pontibacillus marinus BH030004 = DSM 16465]
MKYRAFYRITVIVFMFIKFLWQIFWFRRTHRFWDESAREKWESLLVNQAKEYRKKSLELEGLLIKFGQFLSTRADLLPPVFLHELEGLVDRVEPVPPHISKEIIQKEWNGNIEDYIQDIEDQPVASASIGEVYKAYLLDGTPVAIKVQRHRVEEIFRTDFKALRIVFWILARVTSFGKKADLGALYRELVMVISKELDFQKELKHSLNFQKRYQDWEGVYVPEYYEHLSTRRVLVMEWIEGAKVTDSSFIRENGLNREQIAKRVFDLFTDQLVSAGMFHADPHSGNLMIRSDGTLVMIDFGMVGEIKQEDASNIRMMIQGFILDDYDAVIRSLEKMDFLLPHANQQKVKRLLKETADMYLAGNFEKFDQDVINQILSDVQEFVQDQPIQLPADYAFLGRASSIVIGVLTSVYPEVDLMKWGKPVIQQWVSGNDSNESIYLNVLKESAKPLLSLPRSVNQFLTDGALERAWKERYYQRKLFHQFYLFYGLLSFIVFTLSAGVAGFGYVEGLDILLYIGISVSGASLLSLLLIFIRHFRNIYLITNNRRNNSE